MGVASYRLVIVNRWCADVHSTSGTAHVGGHCGCAPGFDSAQNENVPSSAVVILDWPLETAADAVPDTEKCDVGVTRSMIGWSSSHQLNASQLKMLNRTASRAAVSDILL